MPAAPDIRFGVIVLNYRDAAATVECIDSILSLKRPAERIVLVDNGADAASREHFRRRYRKEPRIRRLHFSENRGYTGGNNAGIALLLREPVDVICLLNNDTLLRPGFFEALSECFRAPQPPDIVSPLILCADRRTVWSAGERTCYPFLISRTRLGRIHRPELPPPERVNSVTGCAMAVRREVFRRIGLLDDAYFAYVEDVDFCKRAVDAGMRIAVCPQALLVHKVSRTAGPASPAQLYLKTRNRAYFLAKNLAPLWWPAAFGYYAALNLFWIARKLAAGDAASLHAILLGMGDWLRGRMGAGRVQEFLPTREPPRAAP